MATLLTWLAVKLREVLDWLFPSAALRLTAPMEADSDVAGRAKNSAFDRLRLSSGKQSARDNAASILAIYCRAEMNGLAQDDVRRLLSDLLVTAQGEPYTLDASQFEAIWSVMDVDRDGLVTVSDLESTWSKWVEPIIRPRSALIIVDVQNDFIDGSLGLKNCPAQQDAAAVVPVINQLRKATQFQSIVATMDAHPENHCSFIDNVHTLTLDASTPVTASDAKAFDTVLLAGTPPIPQKLWPRHCVQGSWGEAFHADLVVEPTDYILRKGTNSNVDSYSAFWDNAKLSQTALFEELRRSGITDVFVCGLAFDVCVGATVMHAVEHGFRTVVIEDACAGVSNEGITDVRQRMLEAGVHIVKASGVPALVEGRHRSATLAATHARSLISSAAK